MSSDMVISEHHSDLLLKVPHGGYSWRFPAHSLLLRSRSTKIAELIEDRPADERPMMIPLVGNRPETVLALLRYVYSNEHPPDITADLLEAAEKYGLPELRSDLEDRLLPTLDVSKACQLLVDFDQQPIQKANCIIQETCLYTLQKHAWLVFDSDRVQGLSKQVILQLLESHKLNVPDEAIVFWGVWNWGRRQCCQSGRPLDDCSVANYLDEMLVLMRYCGVKQKNKIPRVALKRFSRCLPRRCRYEPPDDIIEQSLSWHACDFWEDVEPLKNMNNLCIQVSFYRRVMLVGITLEICAEEISNAAIQIFREQDSQEIHRQEIDCFKCSVRKLGLNAEPEPWLEASLLLTEPSFLLPSTIYSIWLRATCKKNAGLPRSNQPMEKRPGVSRHGQGVLAVKQLHYLNNVEKSWM